MLNEPMEPAITRTESNSQVNPKALEMIKNQEYAKVRTPVEQLQALHVSLDGKGLFALPSRDHGNIFIRL
jgi:hypothetical protein